MDASASELLSELLWAAATAALVIIWFAVKSYMSRDEKDKTELDEDRRELAERTDRRFKEVDSQLQDIRQDINRNMVRPEHLRRLENRFDERLERQGNQLLDRMELLDSSLSAHIDALKESRRPAAIDADAIAEAIVKAQSSREK